MGCIRQTSHTHEIILPSFYVALYFLLDHHIAQMMYVSPPIIHNPSPKMIIKRGMQQKEKMHSLCILHTLIFHDLGINILNYSKLQNV